MKRFQEFMARFSSKRQDERRADLERELRSHMEVEAEEQQERGLPFEEAQLSARRTMGNPLRVAEGTQESWGWTRLDRLVQDVRFGVRLLVRDPGFSLLAVSCLTLGIGANAAVFSWIEGLLLRPYPAVAHQEQLLAVVGTARGVAGHDGISWPDLLDMRKRCSLVDAFIVDKIVGATLNIGDRAEIIPGSLVSANYFDALGIRPFLGRGFHPGEETGRNAHPVIVISYQLWENRFKGDPGIIGKTQVINSVPHTIIGVAPNGFYGTFVGYAFQFWVPVSMQEKFEPGGYKLEDRDARWIEGFVRLKTGATRAQAQQEMTAVAAQLESEFPAVNKGRSVRVLPLWETPFNSAGALLPVLATALAVSFLVLLIACANVGNLLLARSFARRHEITVRLALGAGRGRLLAQLLTEGLILSSIAAAAGLVAAYWCRNALVLVMPWRGVPIFLPGTIDWRVLAFSAGMCLLATVLAGLVPALQAGKLDVNETLRAESSGMGGGKVKARLRSGLVLIQVALSFVLLVGAGLVIHSLQLVRNADPGFAADGLLLTPVNVSSGYDPQRLREYQQDLLRRVQAISGVESAAYSRVATFSYRAYSAARIAVDDYVPAPGEQPTAEYNEISPAYFATLRIPLLAGREFTTADDEDAPPVAIVNDTMVARYWRGLDPTGKRLQVNGKWTRIIGVARTIKYQNFLEPVKPFFYVPLRQHPANSISLSIRTSLDPGNMARALAHQIQELDPDLPVYEVITMRKQLETQTSQQRIAVILLGVFAGLALLLASVGLYGMMSYAVSQSTRELGLRMALGATASDLLRLVVSNGMALCAAGLVLGFAGALAISGLIANLLYQISPRDPLAFSVALALMLVVSLAACLLPAWRASRIDPIRVLRG